MEILLGLRGADGEPRSKEEETKGERSWCRGRLDPEKDLRGPESLSGILQDQNFLTIMLTGYSPLYAHSLSSIQWNFLESE